MARTEHGLAVVNGIPTVVGGVAAQEFLASVEQLDSSNDEDIPYQREWRLVSQVSVFILIKSLINKFNSQVFNFWFLRIINKIIPSTFSKFYLLV